MEPMGPKLAEGRDSEIFEHGPGRVLRLARNGRSLVAEAEVMQYARGHGYPVPDVYDAGEGYLVMDRLAGRTLLDHAVPFRIGWAGAVLADLHNRLHELRAPDWLPEGLVPGDRLVHRDLHPLNVLVTADGPVVIDWANACRADPALDVADMWVVFRCGEAPLKGVERLLVPIGRRWFLRSFLSHVDRDAARRLVPVAAEFRFWHPNHTDVERVRMARLAEWASNLSAP